MKINLFTTFYYDSVESRQREYDYTIKKNIEDQNISQIIFLIEPGTVVPYSHPKIKTYDVPARPTYKEFMTAISQISGKDDYNIIAVTDIYFDNTIKLIETIDFNNVALSLNRWDILNETKCRFFNRYYTSDTWIFKGIPEILESNFYLGQPGCDNRFIYDLHQAGYTVLNPSLTILTWHLHTSQIRTYLANPEKYKFVDRPYMYTLPSFLNNEQVPLQGIKKHLYRQVRYNLNKAILKGEIGDDILVYNKPNKLKAFINCFYYFNYSRKNKGDIELNRAEV